MKQDLSMLDIVIHYINIVNSNRNNVESYEVHKNSALYLLKQTVRHLVVPKEKYFLSEAAKEIWCKIRTPSDDIYRYWYRDTVTKTTEGEISVQLYKGASKLPYQTRTLNKGDKFIFKDVFHDDHIIPIKLIIKRLLNLKYPTRQNVRDVLENISVCRMLKSEDRKITEKHNRPFNEEEIIEKIYGNNDIRISDYKMQYTY